MKFRTNCFDTFLIAALLCMFSTTCLAQSTDQSRPTPILANELNGTIAPLDVGDPRLTRHFYAFEANPGDLIITMDGKNLNGDIDVFTAVTFRPLMKTTLYASTQMPEVTKSIYLRAHQILILRLEARTPNDEPGSYHVRFRGTFEAFSGGIPVAETTESTAEVSRRTPGTKRVSSVGETIVEAPVETTVKAEPKPSPASEPRPVEATTGSEKPVKESASAKSEPPKSTIAKSTRSTSRNARGRPSARSKPTTPKPAPPRAETAKTLPSGAEATKSEPKVAEKESVRKAEEKPAISESKPPTEKPAAQETVAPPIGPRLIIEQKDGTKIEKPMSTVRRVVVEGNIIVIVLKTGRIERVPMSAVARMAIEP